MSRFYLLKITLKNMPETKSNPSLSSYVIPGHELQSVSQYTGTANLVRDCEQVDDSDDLYEVLAQIEKDYSGNKVFRKHNGDLLFSDAAMAEYLKVSMEEFKKLVDGTLYDGFEWSFPAPVAVYHHDFWILREVRDWELAEARSPSRYEAILLCPETNKWGAH